LRAVQVSFFADPLRRPPEVLLNAWPTLHAVARASIAAGIETTVVHAAARDVTLEREGVTYHFVREPTSTRVGRRIGLWTSPGGERTATRALACKADIVHAHSLGFPRQLHRLTRHGARVLVQDHADSPPPLLLAPLWRRALSRVRGVLFHAREQATPFVDAGALSTRTPIFELPESSSSFTPGRPSDAGPVINGNPCCAWVGTLSERKDPFTALDAFETASHQLPEARLWMCFQGGPLEQAVRRRIAGSAVLRPRVHLLGRLAHARIEDVMRAADVLLMPSRNECSGFALMEAMACGTCPVVTDIPSFRRMLRGGLVGALVPAGDAGALAAALVRTAAQDRAPLRERVREHFDAWLSFDALGRELIHAYRAAIS
jgi:glycosyltransferase involved in cell wall biosynthesis